MFDRDGTPGGIPEKYAPVRVSPAMAIWLRLDEELIGALDFSGCYHDPAAVGDMLDRWKDVLWQWFSDFRLPQDGEFEMLKTARWLLRQIGGGRSEVAGED